MVSFELAAAFFTGLLAGEELVIRFGVRGPLSALDQPSHIRMRQGLIRTLRVFVPILYALALAGSVAVAVIHRGEPASTWRWTAVALLAIFMAVTLGGTVPINQAALTWDPPAPPPDWQALVARWERLDSVRTALALAAFASALAGVAPVAG